jgi:hypothetical protein
MKTKNISAIATIIIRLFYHCNLLFITVIEDEIYLDFI